MNPIAGLRPVTAIPDRSSGATEPPRTPVVAVPEHAKADRCEHRNGELLRLVSAAGAKMGDVPWNPTPLIGRRAEISTLLSAVDEANARRAGAVLLSGDAGVGKTRLLDEVATGASERGFTVLAGHCSDFGDAGLPYLPFTEIFGRLTADRPELTEELQRAYPPIHRLLPNQRLIGAESAPGDERINRAALFDAVLGALTQLAEKAPVLLVIEDLHWAEESTRDLLGFLLTRLGEQRLAVLASYRSDDLHRRHPLRRPIAEWSRLPRVRRLALAPLDGDETRALIGSLHPGPLPEEQVQRIVDRAGGNAFFTEELVAATSMGDDDAVPPELADLLMIRMDTVSEDAAQVARVAAVAGRKVSHPLLSTVAEMPDRQLDTALRELVDAHVIEQQGETGYGFRHALLAEAVYDDLLPGERVRLHAAYAAALQTQMVPGTAAELARHATNSHDLPTAFEARIRAGDEAISVAAPQEALQHYEKALELFDNRSPDSTLSKTWLMNAAAQAAYLAAQQLRSLKLLRRALAELPPDAPDLERAELLESLATTALVIDEDPEAFEATSHAIRLVPEEPPTAFRARIASLHARAAMAIGRYSDSTHWANHALDVARRLGNVEAAADATTTLAVLRRKAGDPEAAIKQLAEAAAQARVAGDTATEMRSLYLIGSTQYELGQIDQARQSFDAADRRAVAVGRHWAAYGFDAHWMLALAQYVSGEWDASLRTARTDETLPTAVEAVLSTVRLAVRAGRGDLSALDDAERLRSWWKLDSIIAIVSSGPYVDLLIQQGRPVDALTVIDEVVATVSETWQNVWFLARIRLAAIGLAALSAQVVTEPEAARLQWVARGNQLVEDGRTTAEKGKKRMTLGVEALAWQARLEAEWDRLRWLADSDPPTADELIASWRRAVEAFEYGDVYETARSRARLAAVLRASGNTTEAAAEAARAEEVARRLNAKPLLMELSAGETPAGPAALTAREGEVLALLVEGRTNRELARQLYISEKTVSVHVSNILAKLGVRSRTEAAAVARRDGLV